MPARAATATNVADLQPTTATTERLQARSRRPPTGAGRPGERGAQCADVYADVAGVGSDLAGDVPGDVLARVTRSETGSYHDHLPVDGLERVARLAPPSRYASRCSVGHRLPSLPEAREEALLQCPQIARRAHQVEQRIDTARDRFEACAEETSTKGGITRRRACPPSSRTSADLGIAPASSSSPRTRARSYALTRLRSTTASGTRRTRYFSAGRSCGMRPRATRGTGC